MLLVLVMVLSGCAAPAAPSSTAPTGAVSPQASTTGAALASATSQGASAPAAAAPSAAAVDPSLATVEAALQQIYDRVNPSVVMIEVVAKSSTSMPGFPGFGGQNMPQQEGLGSGFVWDTAGHIVTNNHVVENATAITVRFYDGSTAEATLVGADADSDLAVIKVNAPSEMLRPVTLGDSTSVKVGQWAIAIGNPFGEQNTMTTGIISALGRSLTAGSGLNTTGSYVIPDILQTDAPINPGNSGGVLLDSKGDVIGVPTAIQSSTQSSAGIGYAVPSAIVKRVVPDLIKNGRYEHTWLGIVGGDLSAAMVKAMNLPAGQRGALVSEVVAGGPAASGGVKGSSRTESINGQQAPVGGDVIVAINGQNVKEFSDVVTYLARNTSVGDTVTLTVLRDGKQLDLQVTLRARPASQAAVTDRSTSAAGGYLGITGKTVTSGIASAIGLASTSRGVLVESVVADSPAEDAGLRGGDKQVTVGNEQVTVGGDVIIGFGNQSVSSMDELKEFLQQSDPGDRVTLTILRDGRQARVRVVLGDQPTTSLPVA